MLLKIKGPYIYIACKYPSGLFSDFLSVTGSEIVLFLTRRKCYIAYKF